MAELKTTSDLRKVLFDTIDGLYSNKIDSDQANAIAKVADKIIQSADLEIRFAEAQSRLDRDGEGINVGQVTLVSDAKRLDNKSKVQP